LKARVSRISGVLPYGALIEVNPDAARKRREEAAKDKRVEMHTELSGNCQLAGRA